MEKKIPIEPQKKQETIEYEYMGQVRLKYQTETKEKPGIMLEWLETTASNIQKKDVLILKIGETAFMRIVIGDVVNGAPEPLVYELLSLNFPPGKNREYSCEVYRVKR